MKNLKPASLKTFVSGYLSYEAPKPVPPMPRPVAPMLPAQDYITKPTAPQGVRGIQPLLPNV